VAGLRGALKAAGASVEKKKCPRRGHTNSIRQPGKAGCGAGHKRREAAESQGNGREWRKGWLLRGIPEMGICTGIVVLVDNYTVN